MNNTDNLNILRAESAKDIELVRELFLEYAQSLNFHLCFQDFERELAELPGEYAQPYGLLLLLMSEGKAAGCVALRKIDGNVCEMKRLYVRPEFRGKGLGKKLTLAVIDEAKKIGYRFMRLDTVSSMREAIKLYQLLGFRKIEPYRQNPIEGAIFMELDLKQILK
jgi:putative acetyltransferase